MVWSDRSTAAMPGSAGLSVDSHEGQAPVRATCGMPRWQQRGRSEGDRRAQLTHVPRRPRIEAAKWADESPRCSVARAEHFEHGEHPAVLLGGRLDAELVEDVLNMGIDGLHA